MGEFFARAVCDIYDEKGLSVDQKVQNLKAQYQLPDEYDSDLKKVFTGRLPLVRALEVVTRFQENRREHIRIYEQPSEMDCEVQEALARLFAYVDNHMNGVHVWYERWNDGEPTETGKNLLHRYMESKNITGIDAVYQKVVRINGSGGNGKYELTVVGDEGSSYYINMLTGLVVG